MFSILSGINRLNANWILPNHLAPRKVNYFIGEDRAGEQKKKSFKNEIQVCAVFHQHRRALNSPCEAFLVSSLRWHLTLGDTEHLFPFFSVSPRTDESAFIKGGADTQKKKKKNIKAVAGEHTLSETWCTKNTGRKNPGH